MVDIPRSFGLRETCLGTSAANNLTHEVAERRSRARCAIEMMTPAT